MKRLLTGINIQYPISELIVNGVKTIETRTYPIPKEYIGKEMVIIETPGKLGKFKARMIGLVMFGESFEYGSADEFYKDTGKHCVEKESVWKWVDGVKKYGWPVVKVEKLEKVRPAPKKKGIKFTRGIRV